MSLFFNSSTFSIISSSGVFAIQIDKDVTIVYTAVVGFLIVSFLTFLINFILQFGGFALFRMFLGLILFHY